MSAFSVGGITSCVAHFNCANTVDPGKKGLVNALNALTFFFMWQFSFSVSLNGEAGTVGLPAGTVMPVVYKKPHRLLQHKCATQRRWAAQ